MRGLGGVISICGLAAAAAARKKPPNFIIFQPDEMRAESLGCYGHPVSKTPNLDKLASQGTRFAQAHTTYTVCSQSRSSFMTGWYTHVRGHRTLWALLEDWEPNLLRYFKQANYTVNMWGKNDLFAPATFQSSTTEAGQAGGGENGANPYSEDEAGYYSFLYSPYDGPVNATGDYKNAMKAVEFLKQDHQDPFVLFLPLTKPHPPYSVPREYYDLIDPASLPPLRGPGSNKPDYHSLIRKYRNLTSLNEAFWRKLHAVYLGSISYSDHLLGLVMDALDSSAHKADTTVLVFSDHGDYAGDYGLVEKWPSGLEDVLTRVPLIIRTPGGTENHVVNGMVQHMDIVPTMLSLAGLNASHVHFAQDLTPQLFGAAGDPNRLAFAEGGYSTHEPRDFEGRCSDPTTGCSPKGQIYWPKDRQQQEVPLSVCRAVMAKSSTHKLVLRSDPLAADHFSELYDLVNDPLEMHNVYGNQTYAAAEAELKTQLMLWLLQTSDVTPWHEDNRGYPTNSMQGRSSASQVDPVFAQGLIIDHDYSYLA